MEVIRHIESYRRFPRPIVGLGNFDGVHLGHQAILTKAVSEARALQGTALVLTFHPHPLSVLRPNSPLPLILSLREKLLLFRRLDQLERFTSRGNRANDLEDVPLVLHLRLVLHLDHVHLLEQLVVPVAERSRPRLEDVEARTLLQVFDELRWIGRLRLRDRLRHDLHADVVAPRLVVGREAVLVEKALGEGLRRWHVEPMEPEALPMPRDRVDARGPEGNRIHHAARERVG